MAALARRTPAWLAGLLLGLVALVAAVLVPGSGDERGGRAAPAAGAPSGARGAARDLAGVAGLDAAAPGGSDRTAAGGARVAEEPRPGAQAPSAEPFRGRVVDVATGEPIGLLTLEHAGKELAVGTDGRWRASEPVPDPPGDLVFHDPLHRTHVRTLSGAALVEDPDEGWIAAIEIGPTVRCLVLGAAVEDDQWQARLVEIPSEDAPETGNWMPLRAAEPPWFRYDNPWGPNRPGSLFRVDVRHLASGRAGSSAPFEGRPVGRGLGRVRVALDRALVHVAGRVVDRGGSPLPGQRVALVALGASRADLPLESVQERKTDEDGRFRRSGVPAGAYLATVRSERGDPRLSLPVDVPPVAGGTFDLGDLVVAHAAPAGAVSGRLESRAGRRLDGRQIVRLRALDGSYERFETTHEFQPRWVVLSETDDLQPGMHAFRFDDVPAGEHELSVVPQDGFAWTPPAVRVGPPAADVVLIREDDAALSRWRIDAVDATTLEPIQEIDLQVQLGGAFQDEVERVASGALLELPDAGFECLVSAPGYRAQRLGPDDFAAGEPRVATVALRPGYSARLRFHDLGSVLVPDGARARVRALEEPGLDGVRVRADGRVVATSSGGEAWIELDAPPARIEVELAGWRLVESERFRGGRIAGARDVIVWMVRG